MKLSSIKHNKFRVVKRLTDITNQQQDLEHSKPFSSVDTGRTGNFGQPSSESPPFTLPVCIHSSYCWRAKINNERCKNYKNCETYRYYNENPKDKEVSLFI